MNSIKLSIFGRDFDLKVVYSKYSGEDILDSQKEVYQQFIDNVVFDEKILEKLKKYCLEHNLEQIGSNKIDNIFRYVIPKSIYVTRNTPQPKVGLMCKYKFDLDNGIVLIFKNEKLIKIDSQDAII